MKAVTHLEKVIAGETSAVTHLEKVIAGETTAVTYTEKVIAGEAPPITHLQKVIAGEARPVTHLEYVWAGGSPPSVQEYTGAVPVTFIADGTPLLDYLISGNTTQSGTPTPDNPIMPQGTGERTGQLIDYTQSENGGIDGSGNYVPANNLWRSTAFTPIDETLQYFVSWTANTNLNVVRINYYTSDKTHISREQINTPGTALTIPQNAAYLKWTLYAKTDFIIDLSFVQSLQLMINTGSEVLPYEPYGYKIPISSASTTTPVYLGEVQTTRRIRKVVLDGTENWTYSSTYTRFMINLQNVMFSGIRLTPIICTHYITIDDGRSINDVPNNAIYMGGSVDSTQLFIKTDNYTTAADFKAYLAQQYAAGTPVTVWYVLATEETAVVNEPLMRIGDYADTLSYAQAGVQIPTANGSTTLDVETTVPPSEVYIKYRGEAVSTLSTLSAEVSSPEETPEEVNPEETEETENGSEDVSL